MNAIGYKEVGEYLENKITLEQAVEKVKINTHHYAKRQMTWFRGMERRGFTIHWLDATLPAEQNIQAVITLLNQ